MPNIATIIADPKFLALPIEERAKVMDAVDPFFKGLPSDEKFKVVSHFEKSTPPAPQVDHAQNIANAQKVLAENADPYSDVPSALRIPMMAGKGVLEGAGAGVTMIPDALNWAVKKAGLPVSMETLTNQFEPTKGMNLGDLVQAGIRKVEPSAMQAAQAQRSGERFAQLGGEYASMGGMLGKLAGLFKPSMTASSSIMKTLTPDLAGAAGQTTGEALGGKEGYAGTVGAVLGSLSPGVLSLIARGVPNGLKRVADIAENIKTGEIPKREAAAVIDQYLGKEGFSYPDVMAAKKAGLDVNPQAVMSEKGSQLGRFASSSDPSVYDAMKAKAKEIAGKVESEAGNLAPVPSGGNEFMNAIIGKKKETEVLSQEIINNAVKELQGGGSDSRVTGKVINDVINGAVKEGGEVYGKMKAQIPDIEMNAGITADKLKNSGYLPEGLPIESGRVGLHNLLEAKKDLGADIRSLRRQAESTPELRAKTALAEELNKVIGTAPDSVQTQLGKMAKYWSAHLDTWGRGAVKEIRQGGLETGGERLALENVPDQYFNAGKTARADADQWKRTLTYLERRNPELGRDMAASMEDHVLSKLGKKVAEQGGEASLKPSTVDSFIRQHSNALNTPVFKPVMEKLRTIQRGLESGNPIAERAANLQAMIGANADDTVQKAMSNPSKLSGLFDAVKDNPAATEDLKIRVMRNIIEDAGLVRGATDETLKLNAAKMENAFNKYRGVIEKHWGKEYLSKIDELHRLGKMGLRAEPLAPGAASGISGKQEAMKGMVHSTASKALQMARNIISPMVAGIFMTEDLVHRLQRKGGDNALKDLLAEIYGKDGGIEKLTQIREMGREFNSRNAVRAKEWADNLDKSRKMGFSADSKSGLIKRIARVGAFAKGSQDNERR